MARAAMQGDVARAPWHPRAGFDCLKNRVLANAVAARASRPRNRGFHNAEWDFITAGPVGARVETAGRRPRHACPCTTKTARGPGARHDPATSAPFRLDRARRLRNRNARGGHSCPPPSIHSLIGDLMRAILLWLLGVPIPIIILLALFWH